MTCSSCFAMRARSAEASDGLDGLHQQNVTLLAVTCAFLTCQCLASALPFHSYALIRQARQDFYCKSSASLSSSLFSARLYWYWIWITRYCCLHCATPAARTTLLLHHAAAACAAPRCCCPHRTTLLLPTLHRCRCPHHV